MRPQVRRWSDVLHRWLGFTAGAILVVIGLTGSLLAFYVEIERSFYPHMRTDHPHALPSSYEARLPAARATAARSARRLLEDRDPAGRGSDHLALQRARAPA